MKAILQRVTSASVTVDKQLISSIGKGILVFAAVAKDDTKTEVESMAAKVLKYKIWPDESSGTWKRSVQDVNGEVLCVSQFTLMANTKRGNKPDFHGAAGGPEARELYDQFFAKVQELHGPERVKNGVYQAMMEVGLVNDGPVGVDYYSEDGAVTIALETNPTKPVAKEESSVATGRKEGTPDVPDLLIDLNR
ncbi:D-tyrosyl-tRNA(Tyr) deacylase [Bachmanniomyces sp. S44760]|nr:D-tyrosyl-tRNA(Tyr) deacylase [Bachmanniomyces sp. S44760]